MGKGQGSTEYLVLLAVALIVALVVIGLLGWFPGLGGGARETQSATYWAGSSPFSITAMKVAASGSQLTLANRLSDKVVLTDISWGGGSVYATATNFTGGQEKTVSVTATCGVSGETQQYDNVTFTYNQGSISGIKQRGDKPLIVKCSA
ncbi:MAG: hypothetical protein Q7T16_02800 [Candidatus Burarchaeum sp.]|nr:hypothetical protein [Candidatus Burarchaeum sp.]MDO8339563.1 hypothetical protein [Candidatus Burarchaeum sp.]